LNANGIERDVEALMPTTRLPGDDKEGRSNWKMSRWILCPALKGKPLLDIIIIS
jgi:hypothetical protein